MIQWGPDVTWADTGVYHSRQTFQFGKTNLLELLVTWPCSSPERKGIYLSSGMQANLPRERRRTLLSWTVSSERTVSKVICSSNIFVQTVQKVWERPRELPPNTDRTGTESKCGPQKAIHQKQTVQASGLPPSPAHIWVLWIPGLPRGETESQTPGNYQLKAKQARQKGKLFKYKIKRTEIRKIR